MGRSYETDPLEKESAAILVDVINQSLNSFRPSSHAGEHRVCDEVSHS